MGKGANNDTKAESTLPMAKKKEYVTTVLVTCKPQSTLVCKSEKKLLEELSPQQLSKYRRE